MSHSKVVLITGASSGIGLVIAELLAALGFTVFDTSRRPVGFAARQQVER